MSQIYLSSGEGRVTIGVGGVRSIPSENECQVTLLLNELTGVFITCSVISIFIEICFTSHEAGLEAPKEKLPSSSRVHGALLATTLLATVRGYVRKNPCSRYERGDACSRGASPLAMYTGQQVHPDALLITSYFIY